MQDLGKNIKASVKGDTLTLVIDLTKNQGESGSGKSEIVATSGGNVEVDDTKGLRLGLNLYRRKG